jgi:hypothetical protein
MHDSIDVFFAEIEELKVAPNVYRFNEGVSVGLRSSRAGDAVYLMKITTDLLNRGQGRASETLSSICNLADQCGVTLFLEVEKFGLGLDESDLAEWYWRFGFRGDLTEMVREPQDAP